ncbi:MAG: shikimate kinase [Candidatus Omnitrophota bacterium]
MKKNKNIVIVGFMGTGKTEVSKLLAKVLRRQRLCIDDMIELKEGKTIDKIFSQNGEPYFRKVESEIVLSVSKDENAVIDAGGGVVIDENNVRNLKKNGVIVCLSANPEVIYERTKGHKHRPLLNNDNPISKITELLAERKDYYNRADFIIDTSNISLNEVVDAIVAVV